MIISIAGLTVPDSQSINPGHGGDLSQVVDREAEFSIEATLGARMDLLSMTLQDGLPAFLNLPDRAEIVVYDAPQGGAVTDPPWAISYYNTWKNGSGFEVTSTTPANWTPRLYGGYLAKPTYSIRNGPMRQVVVTAQDYTYRLRSTVCNIAFAAGQSDQTHVKSIFSKYRPDFDTSLVYQVTAGFPAISYPAHTLEQAMQRIVKVSRATYRVDYYKRLFYGLAGQLVSPINWSDTPDFSTTFPTEGLEYEPDATSLVNKVWVIGSTFLSQQAQTYQVPASSIQNGAYQFPLPGDPEPAGMSVVVGPAGGGGPNVDQGTIGVAPGAGDPTQQSTFKQNVLVQHSPAVIMFKTTPVTNATIIVTGRFRFPLIQTVSDAGLISATGGLIFEAIVRDRRISDLTLAQQVGKSYLQNQGQTLKGGTFTTKYRASGGVIIQPGQQATIKNVAIFHGLGSPASDTHTVILTKLMTRLTADANQPFETEVSFADRHVSGGY